MPNVRFGSPFIAMSALPPKADIVRHDANVRFVPKADIEQTSEKPIFWPLSDGAIGSATVEGR
jgi:hypothetical protein